MIETLLITFEQIYTTTETLRRGLLNVSDKIINLGEQAFGHVEQIQKSIEPVTLDGIDYLTTAWSMKEPVSKVKLESRNIIVEHYLSITTLILALIFGEMAGVLTFSYLPDISIIYQSIAFGFLIRYAYIRVHTALDEIECRNITITLALLSGVFIGYNIGPKLLSLAPTSLFISPFLLAVSIDNNFVNNVFPHMDRPSFLTFLSTFSAILSTSSASITGNEFSVAICILSLCHSVILAVHTQINFQLLSQKAFRAYESQLAYLIAICMLQVSLTLLFGLNPILN